jgi:hypothetical protein
VAQIVTPGRQASVSELAPRTTTVGVGVPIGGFADGLPEPGTQCPNFPGRAQMLGVSNIDRCSFCLSSDIQNFERSRSLKIGAMRLGTAPSAVTVPINGFGGRYFSSDVCSQDAQRESRWL